jgi:putative DNA primase/helicase
MNFIQFCEMHGLIVDRLVEGRWKRYKTTDKLGRRNGAAKFMGDHGFVQNHATMVEVAVWHSDSATPAKPIDQARLRADRARERAYRVQAVASARKFWEQSRPLNRPHQYLERKGLSPQGCAGLRTNDGLLVVPVTVDGRLSSVQTIAPDGAKRFWPGAPVKGGYYLIQRPGAALTAFVEGLATGLAVYQAVRAANVVVTFDAGNLPVVVQRLRPMGSVVVCGDNDHATLARRGFNPGMNAAQTAAGLIGAGVACPKGIEGTDWADALYEQGPGAARRIEREILAAARYVTTGVAS